MGTHDDHRKRLRDKFRLNPSVLEDHELIELLLFYCIPRRNTNEEAHLLMERFGSIKNILNSGIPALSSVKGIGENSALFLRVISEVLKRYQIEKYESKIKSGNLLEIKKYLKNLFVGTDNEEMYLLLFTASGKLINKKKIAQGHSGALGFQVRDIVSVSIESNAAFVIVAHNHPNGSTEPSSADYTATYRLNNILTSVGIKLKEHYIVSGDKCEPIISNEKSDFFISKY